MNRRILLGGSAATIFFVGFAIGGSGHSSPTSATASTTHTETTTVTQTVTAAAAKPEVRTQTVTVTAAAPTQAPAPVSSVVLNMSGQGIKNTPDFHIAKDSAWTIAYTWRCTNGFSFSAYLEGDGMDVISNQATSGSDTNTEHGSGTYHLSVNAGECNWTVKVTQ